MMVGALAWAARTVCHEGLGTPSCRAMPPNVSRNALPHGPQCTSASVRSPSIPRDCASVRFPIGPERAPRRMNPLRASRFKSSFNPSCKHARGARSRHSISLWERSNALARRRPMASCGPLQVLKAANSRQASDGRSGVDACEHKGAAEPVRVSGSPAAWSRGLLPVTLRP
jgi:hypothetical protein